MAHYAFIDENNIVTEVIVGVDENELIEGKSPEDWYSDFRGQRCIRTSYNSKIRYNYAGIGFIYDTENDAFIAPKPECSHAELNLNTKTFQWNCSNSEHDADLN